MSVDVFERAWFHASICTVRPYPHRYFIILGDSFMNRHVTVQRKKIETDAVSISKKRLFQNQKWFWKEEGTTVT
ncbi:MAG: hypothetical protein K5839_07270 [Treponemataceae bacterium]|nr:hypothetical protein [Treponemataceae bacterium]